MVRTGGWRATLLTATKWLRERMRKVVRLCAGEEESGRLYSLVGLVTVSCCSGDPGRRACGYTAVCSREWTDTTNDGW